MCCCSRAVSLQVTSSGCRRVPVACGASLASEVSPHGSEWPLSLGGGRVLAAARPWLAAQGSVCRGSCTAHAFIAWSQPLVWGRQERRLELSVVRAVSFLLCSTTAVPGAAQSAGSPGCSVLQGRGAQPRYGDAREKNCKTSCQVCRSKVEAVAVLHWCCRAWLPSLARGWELCGCPSSQPYWPRHVC